MSSAFPCPKEKKNENTHHQEDAYDRDHDQENRECEQADADPVPPEPLYLVLGAPQLPGQLSQSIRYPKFLARSKDVLINVLDRLIIECDNPRNFRNLRANLHRSGK